MKNEFETTKVMETLEDFVKCCYEYAVADESLDIRIDFFQLAFGAVAFCTQLYLELDELIRKFWEEDYSPKFEKLILEAAI